MFVFRFFVVLVLFASSAGMAESYVNPGNSILRVFNESELHKAVRNNDLARTKLALSSNGDLNIQNSFGDTALHIAAKNGNEQISELLVASGADVNIRNYAGFLPVDTALDSGHEQLAELITLPAAGHDPSSTAIFLPTLGQETLVYDADIKIFFTEYDTYIISYVHNNKVIKAGNTDNFDKLTLSDNGAKLEVALEGNVPEHVKKSFFTTK